MSKLTLETKAPLIKMMFLGYSGEGKSSSLVPLSIPGFRDGPGYELRWLDFDGKAEEVVRSTLARLHREKKITDDQYKIALTENNDIVKCTEATGIVSAREGKKTIKKIGVSGPAQSWPNAVKALGAWERSWDDTKILIVDSFTFAVQAMVKYDQELNGRSNQTLKWQEFQGPQAMAETLMTLAGDLQTNVIVTGHQDPLELYKATDQKDDKGVQVEELVDTLMVPISIGRAGRMKLPARFNHLLLATSEGAGDATKRWIYTKSRKGVITKTPFFGTCEGRYPIETGLVDYFKIRDRLAGEG
jgi:hypothetical protein